MIAKAVFFAPIGLMMLRLVLKERFLLAALPGYGDYAERVRYRLVPRLW